MKTTITFLLLLSLSACCMTVHADDPTPIEGEYLVMIKSDVAIDNDTLAAIEKNLTDVYGIVTVHAVNFDGSIVLCVNASASDIGRVMNVTDQRSLTEIVKNLTGISTDLTGTFEIEQNLNVTLDLTNFPCSTCYKVSATKAWGLNRVDQPKHKLLSEDPFDLTHSYMVGPHRGQ